MLVSQHGLEQVTYNVSATKIIGLAIPCLIKMTVTSVYRLSLQCILLHLKGGILKNNVNIHSTMAFSNSHIVFLFVIQIKSKSNFTSQ